MVTPLSVLLQNRYSVKYQKVTTKISFGVYLLEQMTIGIATDWGT